MPVMDRLQIGQVIEGAEGDKFLGWILSRFLAVSVGVKLAMRGGKK